MSHAVRSRSAAVTLTMLTCALVAPAGALASKASIRRVIVQASPKIDVVEGHVLTVEGEYTNTKDPAPVEAAIDESVAVLGALKHKVEAQSAAKPKIKSAKSKIVKGLESIIVGYGDLKRAFADKAADPTTADTEATSALSAVKIGKKELNQGIALLK